MNRSPFVSIGMPVYNGKRFIRKALDALLAQDYENIELIISDNASTDDTLNICNEYSAKDSRIKVYTNIKNIGPLANFGNVLNKAHGKFFMWAAVDDMWAPEFISTLMDLLLSNPSTVLAMCCSGKIDMEGNICGYAKPFLSTTGMSRVERLCYFARNPSAWLFYGLYHTDVARAAFPILKMGDDKCSDERLIIAAMDMLFIRKCIDVGDLVFSDKTMYFKRIGGISKRVKRVDYPSVLEISIGIVLHIYVAFFKCYHFNDLNIKESTRVYLSILNGIRKRPYFRRFKRALVKNIKNRISNNRIMNKFMQKQ